MCTSTCNDQWFLEACLLLPSFSKRKRPQVAKSIVQRGAERIIGVKLASAELGSPWNLGPCQTYHWYKSESGSQGQPCFLWLQCTEALGYKQQFHSLSRTSRINVLIIKWSSYTQPVWVTLEAAHRESLPPSWVNWTQGVVALFVIYLFVSFVKMKTGYWRGSFVSCICQII